jgi:hypothetical protein
MTEALTRTGKETVTDTHLQGSRLIGASPLGNHRDRLYCHSFCQHSCLRDAAPAGLSRFRSCLREQPVDAGQC